MTEHPFGFREIAGWIGEKIVLVIVCVAIVVFFSLVFWFAAPAAHQGGCDGPCASQQDRVDTYDPKDYVVYPDE